MSKSIYPQTFDRLIFIIFLYKRESLAGKHHSRAGLNGVNLKADKLNYFKHYC